MGSKEGDIWIWDLDEALRKSPHIGRMLASHYGRYDATHLSRNGDYLISAPHGYDLQVLDRKTGVLRQHDAVSRDSGSVLHLALANDGQQIAVMTGERWTEVHIRVLHWDLYECKRPRDLTCDFPPTICRCDQLHASATSIDISPRWSLYRSRHLHRSLHLQFEHVLVRLE